MNTTQTSRIEAAHDNRRMLNRPPRAFDPDFDPLDTPPEIDPAAPLAHLTPEAVRELVNDLLEDWDCPTITVLGLCRAHRLTLGQVRAVASLPRFQSALDDIRAIRAMRDAPIAAAARNLAIDRLSHLARHEPTSATHAKEIRLALKSLITLVADAPNPPLIPTGEAARRSRDGGGGGDGEVGFPPVLPPLAEIRPPPNARDESANRGIPGPPNTPTSSNPQPQNHNTPGQNPGCRERSECRVERT